MSLRVPIKSPSFVSNALLNAFFNSSAVLLSIFFSFLNCLLSVSFMDFSFPFNNFPILPNPPLPFLPLPFVCFFLIRVLTFSASRQFLNISSTSNLPDLALSFKYLLQFKPIKSLYISKSTSSSLIFLIDLTSSHFEDLSILNNNFLSLLPSLILLLSSLLSLSI